MPNLSVQDLLSLSDKDVKSIVINQFCEQLKNSPSVKSTFFREVQPSLTPKNSAFIDNIACSFICSSIARTLQRGFNKCVNKTNSDNYWRSGLSDVSPESVAEGQNLYTLAFPSYCRNRNTCFNDYLADNGKGWAKELFKYVTTDPFLNMNISTIFAGSDWIQVLNLILYKAYRLDTEVADRILHVWKKAYPGRDIANNWAEYNFIPCINFLNEPDAFIGDVNNAIAKRTLADRVFIPGITGGYVYTFKYGAEVEDFLNGKPKSLNFTTGVNPDNNEIIRVKLCRHM